MKTCPECGSEDIGDRWCVGRKLQFYCHNCHWKDTPRIPEKKKITNTRQVRIDEFLGWSYIGYDKYGQVTIYSRTYRSKQEAMKDIETFLKNGEKIEGGPYTAVLAYIPAHTFIVGEMFKCKDGECFKYK
jgi:hypothetical protein